MANCVYSSVSRLCRLRPVTAINLHRLLSSSQHPIKFTNQHGLTTSLSRASVRMYSDVQREEPMKRRLLPPLMAFEEVIWPSVIKSIRSFIFVHFIIRPYLDDEFVVKDFTLGAKQAVSMISNKLSAGDWDGLKGLISDDIVPELKESLSKMNVAQRSEVSIARDDIYLTFPYQIGIIFDDDEAHKRIVEITMVFHTIRGLTDILQRGEQIPMNLNNSPEHRDRITVCNYRFRREYTKGVESGPWTVNLLNQFKPADLLIEDE